MPTASQPLFIGIDIGGTKSAAVIGTRDGDILFRREAKTLHTDDWRPAADAIFDLTRDVCADASLDPSHAAAIGISCGGPLDPWHGVVINPPNLPEWRDVPVVEMVSERFQNPHVALANDANATAIAELWWGAGQGTRHMAYLTFGTGLGAGIILNGALFQGKRDYGGEIGHATIIPGGRKCLCGKRGCLETYASGGGIDRIARENYNDPSASAATVCAKAREGDPLALKIVDDASRHLGIGIANLLQTLDLERIVLGSLALKAGDLFLEPIRRYAREYAWEAIMDGVEIVPAALGGKAQDMAAIAVAIMAADAAKH